MKLSEVPWFQGIYRRIYDVLNTENLLPPANEIEILEPSEVEVRETVHGLCWKDEKAIWFREQPPSPTVFAHELLHLIEKNHELEEIYAYNLSHFAVILASKNIMPKRNIICLFDISKEQILEALRKAYCHHFKNLEDYYALIGVIPHIYEFEFDNGGFKLRKNELYDEKDVVIVAITELVSAAEYDSCALEALLNLLSQ